MWFGGLSYEVANQFENLPKTTKSFIDIEQIFFSKFDLVLEFNHKKQQLTVFYSKKIFLEKLQEYKFLNINYKLPIVKDVSSNFNDKSYKIPSNFRVNMEIYLNKFNDLRKYFFKKYIYTINHKRIALNYLYFSM
jgi:anthranilate/para-aminobenzoate synthase component I